jgi:CDP-diacylglycerol--glycerol-3-phosphate 3-phosphatidyltransferase
VKKRDSWLDVLVLEWVSIPLTRALARTFLTPTQVSIISIAGKIIAAALFWDGQLRYGAAAWIVAVLLDGVDGKLARLTGKVSEQGARLDYSADFSLFVVLVLALASGSDVSMFLAAVCAGTGIASALATSDNDLARKSDVDSRSIWDRLTAEAGMVPYPGVLEIQFLLLFLAPVVGATAVTIAMLVSTAYFTAAWMAKIIFLGRIHS